MKRLFPVAAVALSACIAQPPFLQDNGVSDSATAVAPVRAISVTGDALDFQPVEPRSWAERNEDVAPEEARTE